MEKASSDTYYINLLNSIILFLYGYGNLAIYILGMIGNLFSIGIFLKKKWRKNVCVFYFLICLLIELVFLHVNVLSYVFTVNWKININNSSVLACKLMFYVTYLTAFLVPTILILASIDRLLISSQNVDTRLYSSRRLAYLLISTAIAIWMLFNIHIPIKAILFQWGVSTFFCYYDLSPIYQNFVSYSFTVINCLFCLLMIMLSILSVKNVRRIRSIPRQQSRQIRSMTKKDFQLLRCLYMLNFVYMFMSTFISFYSIYTVVTRSYTRTPLETSIVSFLTGLFTFTYNIFYCTNFFIFLCVSKAFRQEIRILIYKMVGKDLTVVRNEEEQLQQNFNKNNIELVVDVVSAGAM